MALPLVFPTINSTAGTRLAPQGICNGMTAAWARLSLQRGGCTADDRAQIEKAGLFSATRVRLALHADAGLQLHGSAGGQWTDMMLGQGLKPRWRLNNVRLGAVGLAAHLLGFGNATAYIVIKFQNGGHALGARVTDSTCDFFDPNVGLARVDNQPNFPGLLSEMMAPYRGWETNGTYVCTVTY